MVPGLIEDHPFLGPNSPLMFCLSLSLSYPHEKHTSLPLASPPMPAWDINFNVASCMHVHTMAALIEILGRRAGTSLSVLPLVDAPSHTHAHTLSLCHGCCSLFQERKKGKLFIRDKPPFPSLPFPLFPRKPKKKNLLALKLVRPLRLRRGYRFASIYLYTL